MTDPDELSPPPGTIRVFSDLLCPFAHVLVHRLWTARDELGLADAVTFELRAFPIELFNGPGTRIGSDSEIPVLGAREPDAGWQLWNAPDFHYPNTVLLAFEAIAAARAQGARASELLDRALRRAFWAESRSIGHLGVILEVAEATDGVDAATLEDALRDGRARSQVMDDRDVAAGDRVAMSPHVFLPDGTDVASPGVDVHWQGDWAKGFPVIDGDDPSAVADLLRRSAA